MISLEKIEDLATRYQMPVVENVAREYLQHLFLSGFYKTEGSEKVLFKGGTALRVIYGSPRFSEDLDFSGFNIPPSNFKRFIEDRFLSVLEFIQRVGIEVELKDKLGTTTGGYHGEAIFALHGLSTTIAIEVSQRDRRPILGEEESITGDYLPPYTLYHLPQKILAEEKIEALFTRGKPRDFYDLYFMLRKGLVGAEQKRGLSKARDLLEKQRINFRKELEAFLPKNQHQIIGHLKERLLAELTRQLAARE